MRMNHGFASAAIALLLASIGSANVRAEVRLSGSEDNMVLNAKNATMPEILTSIQLALRVKITLTGATARQFTGVYEGTLRRVLSRLLDGTNYIISSAPGGMIVTVIGPNAPSGPVMAGVPAATAAPAVRIAADDRDGSTTPGPQGWVPTEDPFKAFRPAAANTGTPASTMDQAPPIHAAVDEPENHSGAQGWVPTEDPFKDYRPTAPVAHPAAKAAPPMPDLGALGMANTLMNDEDDTPPAQSANGRTDLSNRQSPSSKIPASLAPMLTPPPGLDN
jgi:hypothetical protein